MSPVRLQLALAAAVLASTALACGDFDDLRLRTESTTQGNATEPVEDDGTDAGADATAPTTGTGTGNGNGAGTGHPDAGAPADGGTAAPDSGPQPGITCYKDVDDDGFPGSAGPMVFNPACPAGWLPAPPNGKFDCDDHDETAFPGAVTYGTTPTTSGSFDYDCDGKATKLVPYVLVCVGVAAADCNQSLLVTRVNGVQPSSVAAITCGAPFAAYRCKLSASGDCYANTGNSVNGNVACY